jgi:hypothetical protein
MKRIKLRQHRFLSLYQTLTDRGQTIAFEIVRPSDNPVPMIKTFNAQPDPQFAEALARNIFETLSFLMELYGPRMKKDLIHKILTGHSQQNFPIYKKKCHRRKTTMT